METVGFALSVLAFFRLALERALNNGPEPLWMVVWGIALLFLAAEAKARALLRQRVVARQAREAAIHGASSRFAA
jgi:hypothetical protein